MAKVCAYEEEKDMDLVKIYTDKLSDAGDKNTTVAWV